MSRGDIYIYIHTYVYIYIDMILGSSARFARAVAYGIISQDHIRDYITAMHYGVTL